MRLIQSTAILFYLFLSGSAEALIFGAAGNDRCGIGTMIWGKGQSISSQSSEQSTNIVSLNTVSVTTGTSGCSNGGLVQNATPEEILYANINFEELLIELAAGKGEVLSGLTKTMGCESDVQGYFSDIARLKYVSILPNVNVDPNEFLMNIKNLIAGDLVLSNSCRRATIGG